MVIQSIESIVSILLLITAGFLLFPLPWFGEAGKNFIATFAVQVGVPCYMFYNVVSITGSPAALRDMLGGVVIPIAIILACLLVGIVASALLGIKPPQRSIFLNAVAFSNTVFIGLPVVTGLFGEEAAVPGMVYYMGNTIVFWTVGVFLLRQNSEQRSTLFSKKTLKGILSPPLLGFLLGMVVVAVGIAVPPFLWKPISMLSNTTSPLALLFIGCVIRTSRLDKTSFVKLQLPVILIRFVLIPLCMVAVCRVLPVDTMTRQVFFVMSAMPAMTQLGIMAKETKSDVDYAASIITLTTIISLLVIPVYVQLLTHYAVL